MVVDLTESPTCAQPEKNAPALWVDAHRPTHAAHVCGNAEAVGRLLALLQGHTTDQVHQDALSQPSDEDHSWVQVGRLLCVLVAGSHQYLTLYSALDTLLVSSTT